MSFNNLSKRISNLRRKQGLTLEDVGNVVGVGKSTVRKWETGAIANMRIDKINLLAKALHTTPEYIMGWDKDDEEVFDITRSETLISSDYFISNEQSGLNMIQQQIKLQRAKKGYSYSQLSALTGIPKTSLQRYETGTTTKIPIAVICKLEKAFDLKVGTLTGTYNSSNPIYIALTEHEEKEKNENKCTCFSKRLKLLMSERELRQIDVINLAKPYFAQMGTSLNKNDLSQYLSGKVKPKEEKLSLLSLALGVNKAWLVGYENSFDDKVYLSSEERQLIELYRASSSDKKALLLNLIQHLK